MSKKEDVVDPAALADEAVAKHKQERSGTHSLELRQTIALEQIADQLAALRALLTPQVASK